MLWIALALACASPPSACGADRSAPDRGDSISTDSGSTDSGSTDSSAEAASGSLRIVQLHLSGWSIGESALVIGPDGTTVLIDVGNDSHEDEVREALLACTGDTAVDWVLLTHYHADHIGAIDNLFESGDIELRQAIVSRGAVDLDADAASASEFEELCELDLPRIDLCSTSPAATCDLSGSGAPWPATDCAGLNLGDLAESGDSGPAHLALGGGATLEILAVNGRSAAGAGPLAQPGYADGDAENARSLVGLIQHGSFAYAFGGDLTGGGKGTPNLEAQVVASVANRLPAGGVDVLQLNHHGIDSSTGAEWLDALLPEGGADHAVADRQVIVGSNHVYLSAPDQEVLDRIGDRIGNGAVWVTEQGSLAGEHTRGCTADGSVTVRTLNGGAQYQVEVTEGSGTCPSEAFTPVSR